MTYASSVASAFRLDAFGFSAFGCSTFGSSAADTSGAASGCERPLNHSGFTAASALSPLWADPYKCEKNETPLDCEYRVNRPILAFIIMGTNDHNHRPTFKPNLRKIVERSIELGVIPVLVTKADNLEGDNSLNATIAAIANEYDVPLWNYWAAVQGLPNAGLQEDKAHLTWAPNLFDDPNNLLFAWPVRNLNALQTLDVLMNQLPNP